MEAVPKQMQTEILLNKLEQSLEIANRFLDRSELQVDGDGLHIDTMDSAMVSKLSLTLDSEEFSSVPAEEVSFGVEYEELVSELNIASSLPADDDPTVTLDIQEDKFSLRTANRKASFGFTATGGPNDASVPSNYTHSFAVSGKWLKGIVKAAMAAGENPEFIADGQSDELTIKFDGDSGDSTITLGPDDHGVFEMEFPDEVVHAVYSRDYLQKVSQSVTSDSEVTMHLGEEYPCEISTTPAEGIDMTVAIAPRVNTDSSSDTASDSSDDPSTSKSNGDGGDDSTDASEEADTRPAQPTEA